MTSTLKLSDTERKARDAERQRRYRAAHPERSRAANRKWRGKQPKADLVERSRKSNLKHFWGLSIEEWDAMLAAQGEACAICKTIDKPPSGWKTDHCHSSGKIRGVLCQHCNLMLGHARDNTAFLAAGIEYLERHASG